MSRARLRMNSNGGADLRNASFADALTVAQGPGLTVNPLKRFAVPVGVFTENCRTPVAALLAIVICTGRLVAVPPLPEASTPEPSNG